MGEVVCGDATLDGAISASDALGALLAAIGSRYCSRLLCDTDGDGTIDSSDALLVLHVVVDEPVVLDCS